jgi:hypothetical protein
MVYASLRICAWGPAFRTQESGLGPNASEPGVLRYSRPVDLEKTIAAGVFVVVSGGLVILLVHVVRTKHRVTKAWQAFARHYARLHLTTEEGGWPRLSGEHDGREVGVSIISRGSGKESSLHTLASATCRRALPNDFALRPQGLFFALQRAFGAQDLEIGDPVFDRAFVIRGADEGHVRAVLSDPSLRQSLLAAAAREPRLEVAGGQVMVEHNTTVTKPKVLASMLEATTVAARALEAASESPAVQQHQATAGAQHWFLEPSGARIFAAAMMFPVWLAAGLLGSSLISRPWGWAGWVGATIVVAIVVKLLLPPRQRLSLAQGSVVLERGKKRVVVVPLHQCRWWCSPWRQRGILCGSVLFLESASGRLSIGGVQHTFDDPRWLHAAPVANPDVVMLEKPFADLLNGLGYAMRHLPRG